MDVFTPDEQARADLFARGIDVRGLTDAREVAGHGDRWTAAIVAFHEHVWEAQVLARVLDQPYFYIGVMGSRRAHELRVLELRNMGWSESDLGRLVTPIGLIRGAKSRATLASGILADVMAAAKTAGLVA